jgi:cysteinyl-tRNA synthetase
MHNGLTRFRTKKIAKSDPEMAKFMEKMVLTSLLDEYGGELLRFLILSTHYRRPIEFSDEEIEAKRKGLTTFYRLFDRIGRISRDSVYGDSPPTCDAPTPDDAACKLLADDALAHRDRFTQAMDDDFNTAAAIAVLFDLASCVNRFADEQNLEVEARPAPAAAALAAGRQIVELGRLLGLFLEPPAEAEAVRSQKLDAVIQVLIDVRQHCRKSKNFETADLIRDRLAEVGITLVDRPGGTDWTTD